MYYFKRQGVAEHMYLQGLKDYTVELIAPYWENRRGKYTLIITKYLTESTVERTHISHEHTDINAAINVASEILGVEISHSILAYMDYPKAYRKIYPWINNDITESNGSPIATVEYTGKDRC